MKKDKTMLDQIIEYCSKNGITSYELAKHLPLSQVALHGILSGTTLQPRIKNVKLIYDFLFKDENILREPTIAYENGRDSKIAEYRAEIEKIEEKIKKWEEKLKNYPDKKDKYDGIIQGYEDQIININTLINIALEAKEDFLKHNK